tara:strand:+ start:643 stop:789 length:147 start_codon:yes stop_codon:yes gene_type:complete
MKDYWLQDNSDNLNEFHKLEVRKEDNSGNVFLKWGSETMIFDVEEEEK